MKQFYELSPGGHALHQKIMYVELAVLMIWPPWQNIKT